MRSRWRLLIVLLGCLGAVCLAVRPALSTSFVNAPDVPWVAPAARAIQDLGTDSPAANLGRDYDCAVITYTMLDDLTRTQHQGCFLQAAFGYIDYSSDIVLLNGANGAEQVLLNGQPPALRPFPYSAALARFGGFPVEGTYMYVTPYFPTAYHIVRDALLRPHLELDLSHELPLRDSAGRLLTVNPTALGFSGRGEWLVTESPGKSLIRMNTATYEILPFAPAFSAAGFPYASYGASMAITRDGRYAAYASEQLSQLKVYDLASCAASGSTDPLAPATCQSYDYRPYINQALGSTVKRITNLSFVGDGILKFTAMVGGQQHDYELAPTGQIASLIPYLGLGDSYSSGEGAGDYRLGTDTTVDHCHNSVKSYPLRLSADLFGNAGQSVACSGAVTHDITNGSKLYAGQVSDHRDVQDRELDGSAATILHDFIPGYLPQQDFVETYQPGVITVGIGGNDVGFGNMLLRCVSPLGHAGHRNPNTCYSSYEDRLEVEQTIDRVYPKLVALYQGLMKQNPLGRVYVIGYPHIVSATGSCGLNVHMTAGDINFARDSADYLNSVIARAAQAAGVTYVDISDALEGYELCQSSGSTPAVNGLTVGTDEMGLFSKGSYHPTAFGQELMEQAILHGTHNFHDAAPAAPDTSVGPSQAADSDPLLQAPKTGRAVRTVVPATFLPVDRTVPGKSLLLSLPTMDVALAPSSNFSVSIGGTAAGTITSGSDGSLTGSVTVPADTAPGIQPVDVQGPGASGDPVDVTEPVYVSVSSDDTDGDGLPDLGDSCPGVQNSSVDADNDGLDDACDSDVTVVVPPGSNPGGGSGGNSSGSASNTGTGGTPPATTVGQLQPTSTPDNAAPAVSILQPAHSSTGQLVKRAPAQQMTSLKPAVLAAATSLSMKQPRQPHPSTIHWPRLPRFRWYLWAALSAGIALLGGALYRVGNTPVDNAARRRTRRQQLAATARGGL